MLETFTIDTFKPRLRDRFTALIDTGETVDFELDSVRSLAENSLPDADRDQRAPFAITLEGPPGIALMQRTYRFVHKDLGEFDMFIVPVERRGDRLLFEAIFN